MTKDFIFSASFAVAYKSNIHSSHTNLIQERTFDVCVFFCACRRFWISGGRSEGTHTDSFSPIWQSICDELMIRASSRNLDLSLVVLELKDVQIMEEGPGGPGVCDRRGAEPRHHEG
jgi:hypothetical protein